VDGYPFKHQTLGRRGEVPMDRFRVNLDGHPLAAKRRVKVRHAVLLVKHGDHDAVKPRYLGHLQSTMASSRRPIKKQDLHLLEALAVR
jgi:hypothetical protein